MILYHGSSVEVKEPKIISSFKGKDFGPAFYLTPIKEQAERMAKRKQKLTGSESAIVNVFEWDENIENLSFKKYEDADMEWLEMILKCRTETSFHHKYDVVEGKIADDSVGMTVLYVQEGVIKKEDAIERLKFQQINSQIAFCSEKSLKGLKFLESYEVK